MMRRPISLFGIALVCLAIRGVSAVVFPSTHELYSFDYLSANWQPSSFQPAVYKRDAPIPLIVTNSCPETIWPGIGTSRGEGPEPNGFQLDPGKTQHLSVGPTWMGRVWGRTNCTASGDTATCSTGDCNGKLACEYSGAVPVTLAEFNLAGGLNGTQTFYDISLVDGYNLPLAIIYHPASNTSWIPPNMVSPACIATSGYLAASNTTGYVYTNSSFPMPYETRQTNQGITDWCPWDLQAFPPEKPGDGIYPYPDDDIERPVFDPCQSACAAHNLPKDCCTGAYDNPDVCGPSQYSNNAKAVCPDAYSFAFDDQSSTFIIPSGGGWEVVFCPGGRSTNILNTYSDELHQIAATGQVTRQILLNAMSPSYIELKIGAAGPTGRNAPPPVWGVAAVATGATVVVGLMAGLSGFM